MVQLVLQDQPEQLGPQDLLAEQPEQLDPKEQQE
jgi:hypothetical protein